MKRRVRMNQVIGVSLVAIGLITDVYLQLSNMDMTSLRMLCSYPLQFAISIIAMFVGFVMLSSDRC